jgi:hypothetical protein
MGRELVCKGGNDHVCRALFLHLFPSVLNLRTRLESTSAVGELRCVVGRELVCNGSNDHTCDELFLHLFPSVANFFKFFFVLGLKALPLFGRQAA